MSTLIKFFLILTFGFSLLFKLLNYLTFYRLYKASNDMSYASLDIIKQIKRRFSDCISLGKPIENTESYIRRLLLSSDKYSITGSFKERISIGFLLIFWGLLWFGYINSLFSYENTVLCTIISMVLIYITDRLFDTCAVESGFITFAADYLDNTVKGRLLKANSQRLTASGTRSHTGTRETPSSYTDSETMSDKKNISTDKAGLEMAATDDSELISSIINEFIL